ncbi:hypothetical protein HBI82_136560 [Parastagonospora nodorum]|nr:hypothetical protein HBI32_109490 [Parastagonospora nodorum]KAH6009564.1 hypothetical protein HBI82_136560 [Parastagonospora nodorum]
MSAMPSYRGGYAPRGSRGGWNGSFSKSKKPFVKPDIEKNPLGQLLQTIKIADLKEGSITTLPGGSITDLCYIASYNWRSDTSAAILIPGKPPQWTPLQDLQRLPEDNGQYFRDPNAARCPQYPVAPVVQSVLHLHADFPTRSMDIVACGSTLGNLLRFVRGQDKAFRFLAQVIGNTVFFLRKENDPRELIPNVRGYGHSFPEANTTWENDVKGSETHQRIVQYDLGGLRFLVRFECDGYIMEESFKTKDRVKKKPTATTHIDDLLPGLGTASITPAPLSRSPGSDYIPIEHGGTEIPQHSIFDLKTRSGKYKSEIDMSDIYPQLWIKQVPNFIVAYHDGAGLFKDVRVQDVQNEVLKWEADNIEAIHRLTVLLNRIVAFARNDQGLLEVYCPHEDCLELRRQHGQGTNALPGALRDAWANEAFSDSDDGGLELDQGYESAEDYKADSDEDEPDYTACSVEDCGYCGKCTY